MSSQSELRQKVNLVTCMELCSDSGLFIVAMYPCRFSYSVFQGDKNLQQELERATTRMNALLSVMSIHYVFCSLHHCDATLF